MEELKEVIHKECESIAYYCKDRKYIMHEVPKASDFFHIDKTECKPIETVRCESCKKEIILVLDESTNTISAKDKVYG